MSTIKIVRCEILYSLQVNQLTYHSFMDAGKRHEISGSETETARAMAEVAAFYGTSFPSPSYPGEIWKGAR